MSNLALQAVQQGLYSKLNGDGVLMSMISGVYDAVPQQAELPYLVIGDGVAETLPQLQATLTQCTLNLQVFTRSAGRKMALAVLNRLHGVLHHGSISVGGFTLLASRVASAETHVDVDQERVEGLLEVVITVSEAQ